MSSVCASSQSAFFLYNSHPRRTLLAGIHLKGQLNGWATPKDLILHLAGKLTVRVCPYCYHLNQALKVEFKNLFCFTGGHRYVLAAISFSSTLASQYIYKAGYLNITVPELTRSPVQV